MPPRASNKQQRSPSPDSEGIFRGIVAFLVPKGVQPRRLQVWKQKLTQMGATVVESLSEKVTHIFSMNSNTVLQQVNVKDLQHVKGIFLRYQWLEDSLKSGEKVPEDTYSLQIKEANKFGEDLGKGHLESAESRHSDDGSSYKRRRRESKPVGAASQEEDQHTFEKGELTPKYTRMPAGEESPSSTKGPSAYSTCESIEGGTSPSIDARDSSKEELGDQAGASQLSALYKPPDLNRNITEIFGKLINIYRALGDDRRSFSYYKAIPVIEKLPFKIESADQVKNLPTIGKSLQDHINEIVTTGKLSKLEHFEKDEKVRTVALFGEVWGIGPATALKLYEKGYRTLDDLKNEGSLTNSQKLGLKFFDDIKKKIPRNEVKDMEMLLQKVGQDVLPGVIIVCGGSYRRGKAFCGDLDVIITHPDGESHQGFLPKYVQQLKDINFLREDLLFSIHSTEGTDAGVDTYFGLCAYPGREQRHRIDLKVYPRNIYAFGLIAWTGNDVLNRRLRLLAESKGFRLDDTGLFLRGTKSGPSMNCNTEKEVFDALGFPWLEPHERNL